MTTCCDIALSGDLKILRNAARAMAETTPSIENPRIVCGHFALASQGLGLSASCFVITTHGDSWRHGCGFRAGTGHGCSHRTSLQARGAEILPRS